MSVLARTTATGGTIEKRGAMVEKYTIRAAKPEDHSKIIRVMPDWWGGRDLTPMVPKLFLVHFHTSSTVVELENELIAFLIAFDSQSYSNEAYIHFVGVHPDHRGVGIGRHLYELFFERCRTVHRTIVRCCTSPVNRASIAFHKRIGFSLEQGDGEIDGIPIINNYNRPRDPKVRFRIDLETRPAQAEG